MAQVDFSNATLTVLNTAVRHNISPTYLGCRSSYITDASGTKLSTNTAWQVMVGSNSLSQVRIYGSFNVSGVSGTEFYIGADGVNYYKISNVSFSQGDTYEFIISMRLTTN